MLALVYYDTRVALTMDTQMTENREQKSEKILKEKDNTKLKIRTVRDLKIYNLAYDLAMEVYVLTSKFPKEETYSLTDQIRRSSRSVAMNIREGFAKRKYEQVFVRQLNDAFGSSEETRGWLNFALDCKYLPKDKHVDMDKKYDELNAMIYSLMNNWENFSHD